MDESSSDDCDVVVVGGGLSGLAAARTLIQHDSSLRVTLLEANDRLGGRVLSVNIEEDEKGKKFDLGAHWVGRSQSNIMSLLEEFNIKMLPQFLAGTKVMQAGGGKVRTYNSVLPNVGSWLALLWMGPVQAGETGIRVHSWLKKNTRYAAVKDVLTAAFRCTFGVDPSQMSMLFFLTVSKSAGGVEVLFESTEGSGQEFTVENGTASIVESIAKDVEKDVNILLGQAVNTVEQNDDGSICIMTNTGRIVKCRQMIVCIPPTQQAKIMWAPALPSKKKFAIQSSQMGLLIKFMAVYPKPYWKEMGYSGEIVSSGGTPVSPDCEGSPICITFDDSHENVFAVVGFIGGKLAVQWAEKSQKLIEDAILDQLAECFGSWAYENTNLTIKNWATEPFIEGSPICMPNVGTMHAFAALRTPVGNIHFGGTEAATAWIGYMEGAVQSGTRAALEVLQHIKPQSLSSTELMELHKYSSKQPLVPEDSPPLSKWILLAPLVCVTGMVVAFNLRDKWSHCFIPFR